MSNNDRGRPPILPRRSGALGVGKEIGGAVYVHRQYEQVLGAVVTGAVCHLPDDFEYQVVKYHRRTGAVSFIQSPDFDSACEPTVGDLWTVAADGTARYRKQAADPYIYHHKWLFVADDYAGFDVAASQQRSLAWMALPGVDRSRIGKKSYWQEHVVPRLAGTVS